MFQDVDLNNLWLIISKPDNVPVLGLYPLLIFFTGWGLLQGIANDRRRAAGDPLIEQEGEKVHTWPYLTRIEFLALIIVMIILTVWSVTLNAPLEEPAEPSKTPNPSKAPWYFLGLQEMLVYFDPWFAGVVLPGLIIVGLIVIPYVDPNPNGAGHYTVRERPFALGVFFFGFFVLWCVQIFIGTFLRGPGWNFFSPVERWDPHKVVFANNIDLSNVVGNAVSAAMASVNDLGRGLLHAELIPDTARLGLKNALDSQMPLGILFGAACVLGWLGLGPASYLAGVRHLRRATVLDAETSRLRAGVALTTMDAVVGTNPEGFSPIGKLLDLFLWSLRVPVHAVLALCRVPSLGSVGLAVALLGALFLGVQGAGYEWTERGVAGAVAVGCAIVFRLGGALRRRTRWPGLFLQLIGVAVAVNALGVLSTALLLVAWWLRDVSAWQRLRDGVWAIPRAVVQAIEDLGLVRYAVVSGLFLIMIGVPVKMVLRWTLAVKYIWVVPGVFNI
jgi:hypothetical protein